MQNMHINFGKNILNKSSHSRRYIQALNPVVSINRTKELILSQYSKYPRIITHSRLKYVNFVSNLQVRNPLNNCKPTLVAQITDPESSMMYVNVDFIGDEKYFIEATNHEIWHLYDFALTASFKPVDIEWESINDKDFEYQDSGWIGYSTNFTNEFYPMKGFITTYATLGIDEDKAEIFMYSQTDHLRHKLLDLIEKDS